MEQEGTKVLPDTGEESELAGLVCITSLFG